MKNGMFGMGLAWRSVHEEVVDILGRTFVIKLLTCRNLTPPSFVHSDIFFSLCYLLFMLLVAIFVLYGIYKRVSLEAPALPLALQSVSLSPLPSLLSLRPIPTMLENISEFTLSYVSHTRARPLLTWVNCSIGSKFVVACELQCS